MKITILGAGLLGVTTAYELGKRGFDVTVVERNSETATETSYANGGQLSYNHAEPWATASVLKKLPKWLIDPAAPLVFRPRADWQMVKWGLQFLRNCTEERARVNCVNMLRLGLYSRERMAEIRRDTGIEFDFTDRGILHIYDTQGDFDHAQRHNEFQAKFGGSERVLTKNEVLALEPALAKTSRNILGGIHAYTDENGDARKFCSALADIATARYGVKFLYNTPVTDIKTEGTQVVGVVTEQGEIVSDGYIVATGSYSSVQLRKLGIHVPIYPMKGYSITFEANEHCPNMSITDGSYKIVYSRLGNRVRVAGTAEFAGYDHSINEGRIAPIVHAASELFPGADWSQEIAKWACLRPSTPDGPPIMGKTRYTNLFLNTGHGTLGWTQAAGSAAILGDILEGKPAGILLNGLTIDRYL